MHAGLVGEKKERKEKKEKKKEENSPPSSVFCSFESFCLWYPELVYLLETSSIIFKWPKPNIKPPSILNAHRVEKRKRKEKKKIIIIIITKNKKLEGFFFFFFFFFFLPCQQHSAGRHLLEAWSIILKWTKPTIKPSSRSNAPEEREKEKKTWGEVPWFFCFFLLLFFFFFFYEIQSGAFAWNLAHYIQVTKAQRKTTISIKCTLGW